MIPDNMILKVLFLFMLGYWLYSLIVMAYFAYFIDRYASLNSEAFLISFRFTPFHFAFAPLMLPEIIDTMNSIRADVDGRSAQERAYRAARLEDLDRAGTFEEHEYF